MPRPAKLPDLTNIDPNELTLAVLAVLDERHCGPEWRKVMRTPQLGDLLEHCGAVHSYGVSLVRSRHRIA
jgi:hypothetical protein